MGHSLPAPPPLLLSPSPPHSHIETHAYTHAHTHTHTPTHTPKNTHPHTTPPHNTHTPPPFICTHTAIHRDTHTPTHTHTHTHTAQSFAFRSFNLQDPLHKDTVMHGSQCYIKNIPPIHVTNIPIFQYTTCLECVII